MSSRMTAMITPLLCAIHFRSRGQDPIGTVAHRKRDHDGSGDADDRDQREDRPRDGLLARRGAGARDGCGTRDDEQQVLRIEAGDDDSRCKGLGRREPVQRSHPLRQWRLLIGSRTTTPLSCGHPEQDQAEDELQSRSACRRAAGIARPRPDPDCNEDPADHRGARHAPEDERRPVHAAAR